MHLFAYLMSVTARMATLRGNSQKLLDSLGEVPANKEVDSNVAADEFVVSTDNYNFTVKDKKDIEDVLSIATNAKPFPPQMKEIVDALSNIKSDPIQDLKSGAYNIAFIFTDDGELLVKFKGIEEHSGIKFFLSDKKSDAETFGVPFPGVYAFNAVEKNFFKMPLTNNLDSLVAAITLPSFCKINQDTYRHLQSLDQRIFYVIDEPEKFEALASSLRVFTKTFSGFCKFVFFAPEEVPVLIDHLKTNPSEYPLLVSLTKESKGIVRSLKPANFLESVNNLMNKTAEKLVFNSPLPEDNETRTFKIVNTDTFKDFANSSESDVIIAFTSPRCGFCKDLEPVLQKMADILKTNGVPIKIGNYNIMENEEYPEFEITGVPTVFFLKKGSVTPVKISDNFRTLKTLLTFISEEGDSSKINLADYQEHLTESPAPPAEEEEEDEELLSEKFEGPKAEKSERDVL